MSAFDRTDTRKVYDPAGLATYLTKDLQTTHRSQGVLADNPAHAGHSTYQRIHGWVNSTGNWTDDESRNVAAPLYKQQLDDPLVKQVGRVVGGVGKDGAHNVFAVYASFGDKGPFFHSHVDGRQAAQEPAQQNLQQAEVLQQTLVRQQALELTQQQTQHQEQGPRLNM